jgi:TolB-like protein/DNA-binding winged helix-turn-helix (wHTH) protein
LPRKPDSRFLQQIARVLDLRHLLAKKRVTGNGKFRLGDWTVEPGLDRISRGGSHVNLQPQIMDLLVFLAHHQKEVISADEILENVWEGRVVTSASVYSSLKLLREALGDDAQNPQYIATIPKRGYRLIAAVEFPESVNPPSAAHPMPRLQGRKHGKWWWPATVLAGAGLLAALFLLVLSRAQNLQDAQAIPVIPADHSVAVLPFTDMSPGQDQGWFCDGIAEEILNKLAQVPGLKVSGRISSFAFSEPQADLKSIGRTLGVEHLLEGSLRRDGDRVRVTAQLLRINDGFHVWSQSYDGDVSGVFAFQDDIANSITEALKLELTPGKSPEPSRSLAPYPDFTAYELYLQARGLMHQKTRDSLIGALHKLEKALVLEPELVSAHVAMAEIYMDLAFFTNFYDESGAHPREFARPHAEKALELDPNLAEAWVIYGIARDDPGGREAKAAYQKAISLNPNLARAHLWLGIALANDETIRSWNEHMPHIEKAADLEPLSIEAARGLLEFLWWFPHRHDEAWAIIDRLKTNYPDHPDVHLYEARWLVYEGRLAEAVPALENIVVRDPDNALARMLLNSTWHALGETQKALEAPFWSDYWRYVLSPDSDHSLKEMRAKRAAPDNDEDKYFTGLSAYIFVMLRDWQTTVDVLSKYSGDLSVFERRFANVVGKRYSPAMSLAVAYKSLGDAANAEIWTEFERKALKIKSENGKFRNVDYTTAIARLYAIEGRSYEAMHELERLLTRGPIDPRELKHPVYDDMRELPRFQKLFSLQRNRVNLERQKLGLPLLTSDPSTWLTQVSR